MLDKVFGVGDKVRVREDIIVGASYNGYFFSREMEDFRGRVVTIKEVFETYKGVGYKVKEDKDYYTFTGKMLEPIDGLEEYEEKKSTIPQIKAGYLLDMGEDSLGIVNYNIYDKLGFSSSESWFDIEALDDNLTHPSGLKVKAIYGRAPNRFIGDTLSTDNRELLWSVDDAEFVVGDLVEVVSRVGSLTEDSVFNVGYVGIVTESIPMDGVALLDDKHRGFVNFADIKKHTKEDERKE